MVRLPRNEKQTYRLLPRHWMCPSDLTLATILILNLQGQIRNLLYLSQKWSDCHGRKANILFVFQALNVTIRVDLGHDLGLKLSRSNMKFAISQPKMVRSKYIDWILGIKCNHWVWPWSWTWHWISKVKFLNSRISGIGGPIDIEQKGVIHDHDRDLFVTKMRRKDLPDSDRVPSVRLVSFIITYLKFRSDLPRVNDLKYSHLLLAFLSLRETMRHTTHTTHHFSPRY